MTKVLGIVGLGAMGAEIGLLGACAGFEVVGYDPVAEVTETVVKRLGLTLRRLKRDPKFFVAEEIAEDEGREKILKRISAGCEIQRLSGCDVIIEAAPEILDLKRKIYAELAQITSEDAMLATNTSSISITELAAGIAAPERVVGMHFFNPPTMMGLVEVIPGLQTAEDVVRQATELAVCLGKQPVQVKEAPGFVVNRVLMAMMVEAIQVAERGIASIADIDTAMRLGANFPLGPFKLADLVGLDVLMHACESIYAETGDPKFRPPMMLKQHVAAGRLGRKVRHGFYQY